MWIRCHSRVGSPTSANEESSIVLEDYWPLLERSLPHLPGTDTFTRDSSAATPATTTSVSGSSSSWFVDFSCISFSTQQEINTPDVPKASGRRIMVSHWLYTLYLIKCNAIWCLLLSACPYLVFSRSFQCTCSHFSSFLCSSICFNIQFWSLINYCKYCIVNMVHCMLLVCYDWSSLWYWSMHFALQQFADT